MSRWGCAVTSAAMILNYYGMTQSASGGELNPGSLNQWLNANNGYLYGTSSDGTYSYINFAKIGSLTQQLFNSNKSTTKLEWTPYFGRNDSTLDSDLNNSSPAIVQVRNASTSSHFVVVTGKTNNSYLINDPYWKVPDLTSFGNTYSSIERFAKSQTNLSYITMVVNPSIQMLVQNSQGRTGKIYSGTNLQSFSQISNALYQFEPPISNPGDTNNPTTLGTGVNSWLLPKPPDDNYLITLSASHAATYTLNLETFQSDGTAKLSTYEGTINIGDPRTISLTFSQLHPATNAANITIQSTLNDIKNLYQLKLINFATYTALTSTLQSALNDQKMNLLMAEQAIIKADDATILQQKNSGGISQDTYNILHADFVALEGK